MATETKTNKVEKTTSKANFLASFTSTKDVIAAIEAVSKRAFWVAEAKELETGEGEQKRVARFIKVYIVAEVKALAVGLKTTARKTLVSVWVQSDDYKLGEIHAVDKLELTIISSIKHFVDKGFNIINRVATENTNIAGIDADCQNVYSGTHKVNGWFGVRYFVEPDNETVNKFMTVIAENPSYKESLKTACNVAGFVYGRLFPDNNGEVQF